nr:MAG TPA: hypothetical protein [Caudoviricetes sp.]
MLSMIYLDSSIILKILTEYLIRLMLMILIQILQLDVNLLKFKILIVI